MKIIFSILFLCLSSFCFARNEQFSLDHRISLAGDEGWDCLTIDSKSNHLFITRGNHVDVMDLATEKMIGKINEKIDGAHCVAFAPLFKKGYVTSGKSSRVIVFNLDNLKVEKEIVVGKKPDIIIYDEFSSKIFAFNADDNSISIIDPKTDSVLKTIKLESNPEFAVSDGSGTIYVNLEDKSLISAIDSKEMTLKKTWNINGCESPTGIAIDLKRQNLFSVCANEVMAVTDIISNKVIKTLKIGQKPDGAAFDNGIVFSSNGSGTLTIVQEKNENTFEVTQELITQKGARTMAVDPKTHIVYMVSAKYQPIDPKNPKARPKIIPGSVELLIVKPNSK